MFATKCVDFICYLVAWWRLYSLRRIWHEYKIQNLVSKQFFVSAYNFTSWLPQIFSKFQAVNLPVTYSKC